MKLALLGCLVGALAPLTLYSSSSTLLPCVSSQICTFWNMPLPLVFVTIIMSPLSSTRRLNFFAYLNTNPLFSRSCYVRKGLHLMAPLLSLIACSTLRRLVLLAALMTKRDSPLGAVSFWQATSTLPLTPNYFASIVIQSVPSLLNVCWRL